MRTVPSESAIAPSVVRATLELSVSTPVSRQEYCLVASLEPFGALHLLGRRFFHPARASAFEPAVESSKMPRDRPFKS